MSLEKLIRERTQHLCSRLQIKVPIIGSPMVGVVTPAMVAAISNAGGLGVLPCGFMTAEEIATEVAKVRALTDKPFALNIRVEAREPEDPAKTQQVFDALEPLRDELNVPHVLGTVPSFEEQFEAIVNAQVPVVSFSFGGPREEFAEKLEAMGVEMMGSVNSTREAKVLKVAGCGTVIAQGVEAGGPRQYFENPLEASKVGLMALLPPVRRVCGETIDVVAAGGMMSAQAMIASILLGANGVQIGSLLVRSSESAWPQALKDQVPWCDDASTRFSNWATGRETRVIPTGLFEALKDAELPVSPYPGHYKAMSEVYRGAINENRADLLEMPLGQAAQLAPAQDTKTIIDTLMRDFETMLGEDCGD